MRPRVLFILRENQSFFQTAMLFVGGPVAITDLVRHVFLQLRATAEASMGRGNTAVIAVPVGASDALLAALKYAPGFLSRFSSLRAAPLVRVNAKSPYVRVFRDSIRRF